ncbi:MAG: GNAT family N-acetyltransferase [Acidobacteriota bacterium]
MLIAWGGGSIVGYIVLYRIGKVMVIANLAVSPEHRGKGIGEALLKYGLEFRRINYCNSSILDVRQSNKTAVSLYRKADFFIIGINKGYYKNPYEDSFVLVREI